MKVRWLVGIALLVSLSGSADAAGAKTVWLCRPGLAADPCAPSLSTTVISPSGRILGRQTVRRVTHPRFDCFYVYPTTSNQPRALATLSIDPELRSIALYQAARYSRDCRVFAPIYRQVTIQGLLNPSTVTPAMRALGYSDVLSAWRDYLAHDNHGRGFVLIGHSQGSRILRRLISEQIDPKPSVRRRLISAIVLGGNVLVKQGRDIGGDFKHIPACHSATQTGCVIAYSTFEGPVPVNSRFGRTTVTTPGATPAPPGTQVVCVNPGALGGGFGRLTPISPTTPFAPGTVIGSLTTQIGFELPRVSTAWISAPGSYVAHCASAGGAHVLQITPRSGAPQLHALPDATWGLHLADANIALGQLTDIVRSQAAAYLRRQARR
jgi:hypothetical protein